MGDRAWVNSRKHLKGCVRGLPEGPQEKGFEPMGKRTMSGRVFRDTSGENLYLLAFCGLLVPNLSRGWGAVFH